MSPRVRDGGTSDACVHYTPVTRIFDRSSNFEPRRAMIALSGDHRMKRIALAAVLLVALFGSVRAGYEEGAAAYQRGDYATALKEWRPLAD